MFSIDEETFITYVEKACYSLIVIVIGFLVYKFMSYTIKKMLTKCNKALPNRKYKTLFTILNSISKYIILFFITCRILSFFGVDLGSILTIAGIGGVTIGLGAQSLVKDFITGIFILFEDQFGVGDQVIIGDKEGIVEAVTMRTTMLRSDDGNLHIIPNSEIKIITNKSKKNEVVSRQEQ